MEPTRWNWFIVNWRITWKLPTDEENMIAVNLSNFLYLINSNSIYNVILLVQTLINVLYGYNLFIFFCLIELH